MTASIGMKKRVAWGGVYQYLSKMSSRFFIEKFEHKNRYAQVLGKTVAYTNLKNFSVQPEVLEGEI